MPLPQQFFEELPAKTDEQLYDMLGHADDYMPEALEAARTELRRRNLPPERAEKIGTTAEQCQNTVIFDPRPMKLLVKAGVIGTLTAFLLLLLSWFFGLFGPAVLGIIGYIGNLPTFLFLGDIPASRETRALICLLIQSPLWSCFWYLVLRKGRKKNDNDVA